LRVLFLGNSRFIKSAASAFKVNKCKILGFVSLKKKLRPNNSISFREVSKLYKSKYLEVENINSLNSYKFISELKPDIIFAQWPKIIDEKILNLAKKGVVGSHPTDLPKNRGRHPLHWLLALGCEYSYLSFFWIDSGVDTGKIIMKIKYNIKKNDNISSIENKLNKILIKNSKKLLKKCISAKEKSTSQAHNKSNYLRRRDIFDVIINLKMTFKYIDLLIKSFCHPYPGAIIIIENKIFRINSVKLLKSNNIESIEIGKIIKYSASSIVTRCADSIISLSLKKFNSKFIEKVNYIYDPIKYIFKYKNNLKTLNL
jgi:methionyl-tRNA formyltransferase